MNVLALLLAKTANEGRVLRAHLLDLAREFTASDLGTDDAQLKRCADELRMLDRAAGALSDARQDWQNRLQRAKETEAAEQEERDRLQRERETEEGGGDGPGT